MNKGEAHNHVYNKYDEWLEREIENSMKSEDEGTEEAEADSICKYGSDCNPICEGNIKWKMGCNPREGVCEKTFDFNCASEIETFGEFEFSKVCNTGECVSNTEQNRAELENIKKEMSHELKSLNAKRDDLKNVMMEAHKNCINGIADMTNVAILEFSTRVASIMAGGLPDAASISVDFVNDIIGKIHTYSTAPKTAPEEIKLKPHEYIKLNCDLYHHFIELLAVTDKELEVILEKANQADEQLKILSTRS